MNDFKDFVEKLKAGDNNLKIELDASDRYAGIVLQAIDRRKARGLTQAQVGEIAGLGQNAVARLERMDGYVRADTLIRVLDALGLELRVSSPPDP